VAFLNGLLYSFVPLFVAMDAVGSLPFVLALTQDMRPALRRRTVHYAMITAFALGLGFIGIGKGVFSLLGISVADFLVAGGLILLILAVNYLVRGRMVEAPTEMERETIGVVPLGTPLVVGPAVLTTLLLLIDRFSILPVIIAFVVNLAIAWLVFSQANRVARFLGSAGMSAISKIMSLLLAAIAIMMIRQGVEAIMAGLAQ